MHNCDTGRLTGKEKGVVRCWPLRTASSRMVVPSTHDSTENTGQANLFIIDIVSANGS
ncbi:hypothetical protein BD309DRAFT_829199, partial [Dichomitus squalens]|uniref:Uncharacterized protein n=1 Tax=Dichomitus squalens TaxID=114155 RepID=A0A4V2K8M3_9APHY